MKKKLKVVLLVLIFLSAGVNIVNFTVTYDLFTRITQTEVEPLLVGYLSSTDVFIPLEVEIWNLNPFPVVIHTANWFLLDPHVNISFENQSLTYSDFSIKLPATRNHYIKPGLSRINCSLNIVISESNASSLPFGKYEFWGEFDGGMKKTKYLKLYQEVNSTGCYLDSDKLPWDWGAIRIFTSNWGFFTASFALISISTIGYYLYKKRIYNKNL